MQNIEIGDVIFILLVLGVIHGIMRLVAMLRNRKPQSDELSEEQ
jgi:hypothetical protein